MVFTLTQTDVFCDWEYWDGGPYSGAEGWGVAWNPYRHELMLTWRDAAIYYYEAPWGNHGFFDDNCWKSFSNNACECGTELNPLDEGEGGSGSVWW